jgi:hypothetical protein
MELHGDTLACKLIGQYKDPVTTVTFPKGIIDTDTGTDFEMLPE